MKKQQERGRIKPIKERGRMGGATDMHRSQPCTSQLPCGIAKQVVSPTVGDVERHAWIYIAMSTRSVPECMW